MTTQFPKACPKCGKVYKSLAEWFALEYAGECCCDEFHGDMRNCPCGTTFTVRLLNRGPDGGWVIAS